MRERQDLSGTQMSSLDSAPSNSLQETAALKRSIRLRQRRYFHIKNSTADGYRNVVLDPTRMREGQNRWDSLHAAWGRPLDVLSTRKVPVRTSSVILPTLSNTLGFPRDSIFSPNHMERSTSDLARSQNVRTAGIRCNAGNYHCNFA